MPDLFDSLAFARGPAMKSRFMLAPLTNCQSHADGRLSDDEFNWLRMRAVGGCGHTMTCAAYVLKSGQGFPGQLGIYSDEHPPGLTRLADAIRAAGSVSSVQLYHGGMRAQSPPVSCRKTSSTISICRCGMCSPSRPTKRSRGAA